jgi:membrane protein YqaA with SNARE-associated domain
MAAIGTYASLFVTAFLAATVFPAQSELVLGALLAGREHSAIALIAVATIGNTLGSCVNWWIGRFAESYKDRRWFPVSSTTMHAMQDRYHRWGRWSLLLSWMPFIGDPLTVAAGAMREPFWSFAGIILAAKLGRYIFVALAVFNLL